MMFLHISSGDVPKRITPSWGAAIWCHVCFWETVGNNWTWVTMQKFGNEVAGPRKRDFLCFRTYIQTVLEIASGPCTCIWSTITMCHQPQIWKGCQMPFSRKYSISFWSIEIRHRGQYKLRYVSRWHHGGLGFTVLQKKWPASTGTSRRDVLEHVSWGTVFGLCHARKGCLFASAIWKKRLS